MKHPNAIASFITTTLAAALVRLATSYHWVTFSNEDALTVAGGAVTVVLFIGSRGIVPTALDVWGWIRHGVAGSSTSSTTSPTASAAVAVALSPDATPAGTVDPDATL